MKVSINIIEDSSKEETVINTLKITSEILEAKALLEKDKSILSLSKDGAIYNIEAAKIYYFESIDNKTFVYTKDNSYESKLKLYEFEEILDNTRFLRISKSMILNIRKINNIKSDLNARIIATLLNGESVIISRSYAKELKKMLGL